jgi:hypothetical protein
MSATIIAFPTKQPVVVARSTTFCVDVLPVDKRGFVLLDACVPMALVLELMALIDRYQEKEIAPERYGVPAYAEPKFFFRMVQPEVTGLVLVESCVPAQLAHEFAAMTVEQPATAA